MNATIYVASDVFINGSVGGGVYKSSTELLLELSKRHKVICFSAFQQPEGNERLLTSPNIQHLSLRELDVLELDPNGICLLPSNGLHWLSDATRYFIYYKFVGKYPIVSVIHDTIPDALNMTDWPEYNNVHHWYQQSICYSDLILTISQCTANDINRFYEVAAEVQVIPWGITTEARKRTNVGDYYCYVGGFHLRKGMATLIRSLMQMVNMGRRINIVMVGPMNDDRTTAVRHIRFAQDMGLIQQIPHVTEEELVTLYSTSKALIYPSTYEGFGTPPMEALRCHCPVIACNASSIPEIYGDTVLYVEPDSVNDLTSKILSIEDNHVDMKAMTERGYQLSLEYTWDKLGPRFTEAFNKVAGENSCR